MWAEMLTGSQTGRVHLPLLQHPRDIVMPTTVLFELSKWLARTMDAADIDGVLITLLSTHVVVPDVSIALNAAELSAAHKLHALDALIYATAIEHKATLVTCDAHFKGLPGVDYTPKLA